MIMRWLERWGGPDLDQLIKVAIDEPDESEQPEDDEVVDPDLEPDDDECC